MSHEQCDVGTVNKEQKLAAAETLLFCRSQCTRSGSMELLFQMRLYTKCNQYLEIS